MRAPWTHEELQEMLVSTKASLDKYEAEYPDARALPPLSEDECREFIFGVLLERAGERALTREEIFLFSQFIAQYKQSIEARMLGRRGRYYVVSEADIERLKGGSL